VTISRTAFQASAFQLNGFQIATAVGTGDLPPWILRYLHTRAVAKPKRKPEPLPAEIEALLAEMRRPIVPQAPQVNLISLAAAAERARAEATRLAAVAAERDAVQRESKRIADIEQAALAAIEAERARVQYVRIGAELDAALELQRLEDERVAALVAARLEAARLSQIELAAMLTSAMTRQRAQQREIDRFIALVDDVLDDDWLDAA
jgi:hypothetical protein